MSAGAASAAGNDAASGRLAARLARESAGAGSHRHARRRDGDDLLGLSRRGGRHGLDLPGLREVYGEHGLPMSLYTDRGSHYFRATKAGEIDRGSPTQVGRALDQLGVSISARSRRRRGGDRSERSARSGSSAQGTEARRDRHRRGRQRFLREVICRPQRPLAVPPAGEGKCRFAENLTALIVGQWIEAFRPPHHGRARPVDPRERGSARLRC